MNLRTNIRLLGAVIGLLALSTLIYSCKKSDLPTNQEGPATVFIKLLGVESAVDGLVPSGIKSAKLASVDAPAKGSTGGMSYHSGAVMTRVIPFSDNLSILATLVPEGAGNQAIQADAGSVKSQKIMSTNKNISAATSVVEELNIGIMYRVVVYDSIGNYVDDIVYTYGDEEAQGGFTLNGETAYTFVAYSTNSTTSVPNVSGSTLSTASVNNVSGDLMYFKKI
ncbi:hypothetical protein [Albibacterium indicum]|uniref:hypothetical protein n=1 Tax=Albibacterium indicum TaxID=2292082 RepID=UPI001300987F|nr:hypothetical protein [Pedobacter indicus]